MKVERRRFIRYLIPRDQLYIFFDDSSVKGDVKNISMSGMAFEYVPNLNQKVNPTEIAILAVNRAPFYLKRIPCKIIYDIQSIEENHTFSGQEVRLVGLQYGKLSNRQRKALESLLKKMSKT